MREDILGALKSALIRGETLKKAMMSLYNAGYKKNEIEETAAMLQQMTSQTYVAQTNSTKQIQQSSQKTSPQNIQSSPSKTSPIIQQIPQLNYPNQASQYGSPNFGKSASKIKIVFISLILIILIGLAVGVFVFREELIEFLNKTFN